MFEVQAGQQRIEGDPGCGILVLVVPAPGVLFLPAKADRSAGQPQLTCRIKHRHLPVGIFLTGKFTDVAGAQETAREIAAIVLFVEHDEERQVSVLLGIIDEIRGLFLDVEFCEQDMDAGQQKCRVGAGADWHPKIGKFGDVRVIRR